jgi:hypothetical protein
LLVELRHKGVKMFFQSTPGIAHRARLKEEAGTTAVIDEEGRLHGRHIASAAAVRKL